MKLCKTTLLRLLVVVVFIVAALVVLPAIAWAAPDVTVAPGIAIDTGVTIVPAAEATGPPVWFAGAFALAVTLTAVAGTWYLVTRGRQKYSRSLPLRLQGSMAFAGAIPTTGQRSWLASQQLGRGPIYHGHRGPLATILRSGFLKILHAKRPQPTTHKTLDST